MEDGMACFSIVEYRNNGSIGWDCSWSLVPLIGLGAISDLARTDVSGLLGSPHYERLYSTKKSKNGHHADIDAKSCHWMLVIMADNGRRN
jgi:hypothetical protein